MYMERDFYVCLTRLVLRPRWYSYYPKEDHLNIQSLLCMCQAGFTQCSVVLPVARPLDTYRVCTYTYVLKIT